MKQLPVILLVSASCVLVACGTARRGEPLTPELIAATPELERGRDAFYEHCHQCHTGGEAALGPAINNKPLPAWLLRFQIRHGLGVMPAFSEQEIDARKLDDLVAYLVALRRHPAAD